MRIVICEDNIVYQQEIRQMLGEVMFEKEDIRIRCFRNGEELLCAVREEADFSADMLFLDIKMPKLDGLQTARELLRLGFSAAVVFLTAHSEYVFAGYEVHAYDYLLKPVSHQKLKNVLNRFLEERDRYLAKYLIVNRRTRQTKIFLEKVLYFVSDKRKITAVMEDIQNNITFYMTMCELEKKLNCRQFFRCHQSFLVNVEKMLEWDHTNVRLQDGSRIPVSKRFRNEINALVKER